MQGLMLFLTVDVLATVQPFLRVLPRPVLIPAFVTLTNPPRRRFFMDALGGVGPKVIEGTPWRGFRIAP
jgi:hypothetical protein